MDSTPKPAFGVELLLSSFRANAYAPPATSLKAMKRRRFYLLSYYIHNL